jgi:hypothetical protein
MKIVLHIDRMVLDGCPARTDARQIGASIERELVQSLISVSTAGWRGIAVDRLASTLGDPITGAGPDALGRAIAGALQPVIVSTQGSNVSVPGKTGVRR